MTCNDDAMDAIVIAEVVGGPFDGASVRASTNARSLTMVDHDGVTHTYLRVPADDPDRVVFMRVASVGAR